MGARNTWIALVLLLACSGTASGLDIGQFDLQRELGSASLVAESTVTQATCIKAKKAICSRLLYKLAPTSTYNPNGKSEYTLVAPAGLMPGATYLHYVVDREIEDERSRTNVLVLITSQPFFSGSSWREKRWLMLPKNLSGERFGAVKLGTNSCFIGVGGNQDAVKLCDYASVVEYENVKAFLKRKASR